MLRHSWLLLIVLFATAMAVGATVHAREVPSGTSIRCGGETHADGDSDQAPADADQGMPHHHGGCHGHAVALEAGVPAPALYGTPADRRVAAPTPVLASLRVDPALRPPRD